jgi:acetyltransferase-like isoleucine patch superfamily enzyme
VPLNIGRGSIVAAGAIVVDDVPENSIVAGNPARLISKRFTAEQWVNHSVIIGFHEL